MARPKKQEVDYFPHYCDHGKVLFILENHFKNDGYAVFYKLEEILAKTEGHCYNCTNLENWEYLLSKMGATEEIVLGVLQKLSAMGIIDAPLWIEKRIWMQSFVDSISDVYSRRTVDLPTKPELLHTEIPLNGINEGINPQSKVKESKVKESKVIEDSKESLSESGKNDSDENGGCPLCPQQEIIKIYHRVLPELPRVKQWPDGLQAILRTRWKEDPARQTLEWWESYFMYVHSSDFLMGRTKEAFIADLEWVIRPKNFTKIANGRYHRGGALMAKSQPGIAAWLEGRQENATTG
uniref:Lin1244/Lin1753-like N-terminal domain-containing protein n=1 Tax=viral metagenome TaxID=1070528 RepID=A0A6H2A2D6_9ZZZZ